MMARANNGNRHVGGADPDPAAPSAMLEFTFRVPLKVEAHLRRAYERTLAVRRRLRELGHAEGAAEVSWDDWLGKLFEAGARQCFAELAEYEETLGLGRKIITPGEARREGWS